MDNGIHDYATIGDLDGVKMCVLNGTDVNTKSYSWKETPLHDAAANCHLPVVEYLVSQKADIDIKDYRGQTPLHKAAYYGHPNIVEYLLSKNTDINIKDNEGCTALNIATRKGTLSIVECLLGHNADTEARDTEGDTALHIATRQNDLSSIKCLLGHDADIETRDKEDNTPLHLCVLNSDPNYEIAATLVLDGADFLFKNEKGETPYRIAERRGHTRITRMFKREMKTGIPKEMRYLRVTDANSFKDVLRSGYFFSYLGKIMLVGNEGVGKTSITSIIIGKKPSKKRKSTEGIDVHISRSAVDLDLRKLIPKDLSVEEVAYRNLTMRKRYGGTPVHLIDDDTWDDNDDDDDDDHVSAYDDGENGENVNGEEKEDDDDNDLSVDEVVYENLPMRQRYDNTSADDPLDDDYNEDDDKDDDDHHDNGANDDGANVDTPVAAYDDNEEENVDGEEEEDDDDDNNLFVEEVVYENLPMRRRYGNTSADDPLDDDYNEDDDQYDDDHDDEKENITIRIRKRVRGVENNTATEPSGGEHVIASDSPKKEIVTATGLSAEEIFAVTKQVAGETVTATESSGEESIKTAKRGEKAIDAEPSGVESDTATQPSGVECVTATQKSGVESVSAQGQEPISSKEMAGKESISATEKSGEESVTGAEQKGKYTSITEPTERDVNTTAHSLRKDESTSFINTILKKIRLSKKERETVTADMLIKGIIKAGKKGLNQKNLAPIIILDFAGQRVFYSTHQSFLTYRGIYILTVNGSLRLDDEMPTESPIPGKFGKPTTREYIEFWVSSIITYAKGKNNMFPKILVVCTHKDKLPKDTQDKRRADIYGEISKMFHDTPATNHLVLDHQIFVNALDPNDPEIEVLKDALVDLMFQQPSWGEKIPKSWIHLEMVINKHAQNGKMVLSRKMLEEINMENPIQSLSEKDLEVFLKVHHSQGDIIYFPLPGLRDNIIIYPAYLVDALKSIVTDKRFCVGRRFDVIKRMNNDGILYKADITAIWRTKKRFQHHQDYVINLMTHLDMLAEPRVYKPTTGKLLPADFFYVPSLVTKEDITTFRKQDNLCERSLGLSFKFHSIVLPSAIGFRFVSCCVEMFDIDIYQGQRMLFSGMVVVNITESIRMLVQVKKQRVDIFLIHETSRLHIVPDIASRIRECLNDTLYRICDSYKLSSSGPDAEGNFLPFHTEYPCFHIEGPCYTEQKDGWVCEGHGDDMGGTMNKWFADRTKEECQDECRGVAKDVLEERPSDLHLAKLTLEMTWEELRPVLIHIGLKEKIIKAVEEDYNNHTNVKFIALRKWKMQSQNGTFNDIHNAMGATQLNVHTLCKVFRDKPIDENYYFEKREPTDRDVDRLASHAVEESLLLTIQLNINAESWLQMKEDGNKIYEINRAMLRKWRDGNRGKRKMRDLAQACSNVGINLSFILSDLYNEN